jgi:3-hydroxybutyrate dehydrogenase/3-oxoacyl-[acyl-carrier protein] reductase
MAPIESGHAKRASFRIWRHHGRFAAAGLQEEEMLQLTGKVAMVTGGTRGIGRAIAEAFLAEGAAIVINGRSAEKGEQALKEIDRPGTVAFVQGDVTRKDELERVVDEAIRQFGHLDILVNNAGGSGGFAPVHELSDEAWQQALDWNLNATFWATRKALQHMIPRQAGRIINISSVEGKHGKPGIAHYVTVKHAINGFTKAVAKEVGTQGITINAICPGLILTDIVREAGAASAAAMGMTFDQLVDQYAAESALKRLNTVEEVAAVAVLLASNAGAGITGALVSVDGGTAQY